MLATPTHAWALPADGSVAAEPKWDGFRALAGRLDDGTPVIRSRSPSAAEGSDHPAARGGPTGCAAGAPPTKMSR